MNATILVRFILLLIPVIFGVYQCVRGGSWWCWGLLAVLASVNWLEEIDRRARETGSAALARWQSWTLLVLFLAILAGMITNLSNGRSWWFALLLSVIVLFLWWAGGLPDEEPKPSEPEFDPNMTPEIPFEAALFSGSDADFTWYVHERFPVMDWKDMAESVLADFRSHVPELLYTVNRENDPAIVTLTLGEKMQMFELEPAPEAGQVMERLPGFLAPAFVVCSYRFTEGSDTWVNPVFTAELWQRLRKERPDRAGLFTPLSSGT